MKKAKQLRELLEKEGMLVVPGVTTPLFARVAQERGFRALFVTGAGLANMNFGLPDYGLITMTENLELVKRINDNTSVPLIVDIDDGYGARPVLYLKSDIEITGGDGTKGNPFVIAE